MKLPEFVTPTRVGGHEYVQAWKTEKETKLKLSTVSPCPSFSVGGPLGCVFETVCSDLINRQTVDTNKREEIRNLILYFYGQSEHFSGCTRGGGGDPTIVNKLHWMVRLNAEIRFSINSSLHSTPPQISSSPPIAFSPLSLNPLQSSLNLLQWPPLLLLTASTPRYLLFFPFLQSLSEK